MLYCLNNEKLGCIFNTIQFANTKPILVSGIRSIQLQSGLVNLNVTPYFMQPIKGHDAFS